MSGEAVVLVGVSLGSAGLVVAAGVAGFIAAGMVADWMREQRTIARQKMRQERDRAEAWRHYHGTQQQEIEQLTRRREAVNRELRDLRLAVPASAAEVEAQPQVRGFVAGPEAELLPMLQSALQRVPAHFGAEASAPLQRLRQQAAELDAQLRSATPPPQQALQSFQVTVQRTLERILGDAEREAESRRRLLVRVEDLLGGLIACRHLARDEASAEDLSQLQEHLVRLLSTGEVSVAGVELLEGKLQRLRADVDRQLQQAAVRAALEERVGNHLEALGYRLLSIAGGPNLWEIPGGERVRVALQPGNRLAFQLVHERPLDSDRPLSGDELAFLRQQERRWCADLHELLHKLQADGFEFQVQLERETPEEAIPVVVVEDVDEWEGRQDRREPSRSRHLT